MNTVQCIVLAAGKGKRMQSDLPKVLHELAGRPLLHYVLDSSIKTGIREITVVVGHGKNLVRESANSWNLAYPDIRIQFAEQNEQKGTGHAVLMAESASNKSCEKTLVLMGDVPLVRTETILNAKKAFQETGADTLVITMTLDEPRGYGRILRGKDQQVLGIREEKDASEQERLICEVNTGIFFFKTSTLFDRLKKLSSNNAQGEYYLTDMVGLTLSAGGGVAAYKAEEPKQFMGINSPDELKSMTNLYITEFGGQLAGATHG